MSRPKWMRLDRIEVQAIPFISEEDICFYYLNRVSGGFSASAANNRIDNFKKSLERFSTKKLVMSYKSDAIIAFAQDLSELFVGQFAQLINKYDVALVPMNTSRPRSDDFHDDRLVQLCEMTAYMVKSIRVADVMDSREYIQPSHEDGPRDYETLRANLEFLGFGAHVPDVAILVDDVLTTGTHYAVCRDAIRELYPQTQVMGAFLCIHRSAYVDYSSYGIDF